MSLPLRNEHPHPRESELEFLGLVRAVLGAARLPEPRRETRQRAWREFQRALDEYAPKKPQRS